MSCKHLGEDIGMANCRCKGTKSVFQCEVHKHCMKSRLTPGKVLVTWFATDKREQVVMNYCFGCPNHTEINFE
jgi:hypothetical protein